MAYRRRRMKRLYKKGTGAGGVGLKGAVMMLPDGCINSLGTMYHPTSEPRFDLIATINNDMKGKDDGKI